MQNQQASCNWTRTINHYRKGYFCVQSSAPGATLVLFLTPQCSEGHGICKSLDSDAPTGTTPVSWKGTLPGGKQLLASTRPHHAGPMLDTATTAVLDLIEPAATMRVIADVAAASGSPLASRVNLPLLL